MKTQIPGPHPESLILWAWGGAEKVHIQAISQVMLIGWSRGGAHLGRLGPEVLCSMESLWGESRAVTGAVTVVLTVWRASSGQSSEQRGLRCPGPMLCY